MNNIPSEPYNNLPILPPSQEVETQAVLKAVISASRALSQLDGLGRSIPNQHILINSVVLQEAKDSSEIENIVTTNDELYQAISTDDINLTPAVKEVINYREALWYGYERLNGKQPFLTTNLFIDLVNIINGHNEGIRRYPGTNIKNRDTGAVVYTPPEGEELILSLLGNIESFYSAGTSNLDPLVKLAIAHYQFEAIHPFGDGNGRTGRILNILYLVQQGILDKPILYLSRYIIQNKTEYYNSLRKVTEYGQWEDWLLYVLTAIEQTALYTADKLKLIKQSMDDTSQVIRREYPKMYSKDLIELLYEQPYIRIKNLMDSGIASRKTSSEYLHKLVAAEVLQLVPIGRDKLFLNIPLFHILRGLEQTMVTSPAPGLFTSMN